MTRLVIRTKIEDDSVMEKLLDAFVTFARALKKKHKKLPTMELSLEKQPSLMCDHEFSLKDSTSGLLMIRCTKCHAVYHVDATIEETA